MFRFGTLALACAALSAFAAHADVTGNDPLDKLPNGSTLTLEMQVDLKPRASAVYFQDGVMDSEGTGVKDKVPYCAIEFGRADEDRVVRPGKQYTLDYSRSDTNYYERAYVMFDIKGSSALRTLTCYGIEGQRSTELTINVARDALGKYFTLIIAPPKEVDGGETALR